MKTTLVWKINYEDQHEVQVPLTQIQKTLKQIKEKKIWESKEKKQKEFEDRLDFSKEKSEVIVPIPRQMPVQKVIDRGIHDFQ